MAIRAHRNGFQVDVSYKGQRAPRLTAPTMPEARKLEAELRADLMAGRDPAQRRGLGGSLVRSRSTGLDTIGALFDHTFRLHWRGTKNERQADINGRLWVEALGYGCEVATLTTDVVAEVCDGWADQGNAPGTINRKLAALRKMLGIAHEEGVIPRIPRLPKRKEYAGRIRYFSDEEEASMLAFFAEDDPDMRDLVVLGLDTGFREGELLRLEVRDHVLATNLLHLWETKSDAARAIPLTERAKDVVLRRGRGKQPGDLLFEDRKLDARRISYRMQRWRHHAGIADDREAVFHTTRHTCCSRLIQAGVGLVTVQKWMGHKTIETTLRYAHLAPNAFDEAVSALNDWRR